MNVKKWTLFWVLGVFITLMITSCFENFLYSGNNGYETNQPPDNYSTNSTSDPLITDGLVAYYPYDGNANDMTGNGNDGIVHGATLTTDRFGNPNSAYQFSWGNYIDNGNATMITNISDTITVSAWVKFATDSGNNGIMGRHENLSIGGWFLHRHNDEYIRLTVNTAPIGSRTTGWYISNFTKIKTDEYNHVAFTLNKSTGIACLYINKIAVVKENIGDIQLPYMSVETYNKQCEHFELGRYWARGCSYFKGAIDDVRLYNRALSYSEINELYHENGYDANNNTNIIPDPVISNGLVAYYPYDGNANDMTGNGNDGIVHGATLTTDRFGNPNSAYQFSWGNYIDNGNATMITNISDAITVSTWVKFDTVGSHNSIMGRYENWSDGGWALFKTAKDNIVVSISYPWHNFKQITNTTLIEAGKYYHITVTFDKANEIGQLYINKSLEERRDMQKCVLTYTSREPWNIQCEHFELGRYWAKGCAYFNGVIDDVRLYNKVLSYSEISELYHENNYDANNNTNTTDTNSTTNVIPDPIISNGLVAYYPYNGNANDMTGNGNDGIVYGATLTSDRFGNPNSAYHFSSGDYIDNGNASMITNINNSITVSAWVKFDNNRYTRILGRNENMNIGGWILFKDNNNCIVLGVNTTPIGSMTPVGWYITNYTQIETDKFYNITFTLDKETDFCYLYVNKIAVSRQSIGELRLTYTSVESWNKQCENFEIGRYWSKGCAYFDGSIDDVRLYNKVLSYSEVSELYHENGYDANGCTR